MKQEDVEKIISILLKVDNECPVCARAAIRGFGEAFPQWKELAYNKYERTFGGSIVDEIWRV